jgi:hypothetical protein
MITKHSLPLICFAFSLFLSGCTIAQSVRPAPVGTQISKIYVQDNPKLLMDGLVPEVVTQIKALGFDAAVYTGEPPKEAKHTLSLTANWRWDMAMYLFYFQATLFEEGRVLGTAEYDARMGGANMGKFGKTAEKIRPLLQQLLSPANKQPSSVAASIGPK